MLVSVRYGPSQTHNLINTVIKLYQINNTIQKITHSYYITAAIFNEHHLYIKQITKKLFTLINLKAEYTNMQLLHITCKIHDTQTSSTEGLC
jgi:hypothetical protein